jgi:asparagine synthase (glutamine-hydrolysing)
MYRAPERVRASTEVQRHIIGECNQALSEIVTDRGRLGGETNPLFAMARELYYYSRFKADYIYLFDLPHWLTRLDAIWGSRNRGMRGPGRQKFEGYRMWFRNELANYVRELLMDERTAERQYLDKKYLGVIVEGHIDGSRNFLMEINTAMTVELIHRVLIDR